MAIPIIAHIWGKFYGTLGVGWLATVQVVDLDPATITATAYQSALLIIVFRPASHPCEPERPADSHHSGRASAGGAIGNAIAPANLGLGASTAGISGPEGDMLRKTLPWTLVAFLLTGGATVVMIFLGSW